MANTNNPFGAKVVGNLNSAAYELKVNKYVVSASDPTPLYLNDFVKTNETATPRGIPICTKADAGEACRGVVVGFEADRLEEDITYRKANEERVVFVCDDPYISLEMQVDGILSTTDIGKYVDIIVNGGDNVTGLSKTQVNISSASINSRQLKIISIVDRERNELGQYSKVNVVIHKHELQHGASGSGGIPEPIEERLKIENPGDVDFTLSYNPNSNAAFQLFLRGLLQRFGIDYNRDGKNVTWLNPLGVTLKPTDLLIARYNIVESGTAVSNHSFLVFGNTSVSATTTTRHMDPFNVSTSAPTAIMNIVIPFDATIKNMHVYHNNPAGNGNNIVYTLLKNAIATSLTVTIPSTTQTVSNTTNFVSVNAGDRLALQVTKALGIGSSPNDIYVTMEVS